MIFIVKDFHNITWGANPPGGTCQRDGILVILRGGGGADRQTKFILAKKLEKKSKLAKKKVGGSFQKLKSYKENERKKKGGFQIFSPGRHFVSLRHC